MTSVLQHLLVATDGSDNGSRAVSFALEAARRHHSKLLFCLAVERARAGAEYSAPSGGVDSLPLLPAQHDAAAAILAAAAQRATDAGLVATTTVLKGRAAEAIVGCAKERQVDAIVLGAQGKRHHLERFFVGTTAEGVLRRTDVPAFVVPPGTSNAAAAFNRILVGIDESDPSDAAAAFALDLAEADGAQLVFCGVAESNDLFDRTTAHGYDPWAMLEEFRAPVPLLLAAQTDRARMKNIAFESVVAEGDPTEEILKTAEAQHADLIVLGTHGRRGLRRWFVGSVAENVVRRSPVPVAVVRASGPRSRAIFARAESRSAPPG